ncbi:MAG: AraC family transcriptional regulator [Ruminococcaceae bacterium]|nr:AraC family transcriptional regulator [Oscillospiraceae bacterium]
MNDYIWTTDRMFFKHSISENLSCDTYSMHTHNAYELIYFLNGDATHVIENRKYKLKKGDLILIRPFQYHFIQIDTPTTYERYDILFDIERNRVESAKLIPEDIEVINIVGNSIIEDIFRKCDIYYQNSDRDTFEKILSHLLSELFYNISLFPQQFSKTTTTLSPLISKALKYTNDNLCTIVGIEEIAEHLFVSESYLFRLFQKELHQTPKKYIMEKRLLLAQKMIRDGEKPTSVFEYCGFGDYTTFYRNYTAFFGYSPSKKIYIGNLSPR